jgi:sRNA-binding carbon storage regulator CsrA
MALVLTLKVGEDFFVNHDQVLVQEIVSPTEFTLRRTRDGASIPVREGRAVEVFRGVFISVGARGQNDLARVAIEAPRNVMLLRGDNYRRGPPPKR